MLHHTLLCRRWSPAVLAGAALAIFPAVAPLSAQSITAPLTVTTLAGSPGMRQVTNGTGSAARFYAPAGIVVNGSGNLIVADTCNNVFRTVTTAGVVTTFVGAPLDLLNNPNNVGSADGTGAAASFHIGDYQSFSPPYGAPIYFTPGSNTLGIDGSGNIYLADTMNNTIRKITPAGVVTTLAGSPGAQGTVDGNGANARFNVPSGVAADSSGNVYVADSANDVIRKVTPAGDVTTIAGTAGLFGTADGTGSAARFNNPVGIAIDAAGNLYVTDSGNNAIRKITPAGVVTTLAGAKGTRGAVDGSGTQALFNGPTGIAVDAGGNVYVADTQNHAIRKISSSGIVTTIAGSLGVSGSSDGTGTAALFDQPYGVTVDSSSNVYVSDSGNDTIRKGVTATGVGSLTVTAVPPPVIQVDVGSNISMKVVATGSPAPTYQWFKNGSAISGSTSATLALSSVTMTSAGNYSVIVTSGAVTFSSASTNLQVFQSGSSVPTVAIIDQPTDQTIAVGGNVTFTVEATSSQALSYQWKKDGTTIPGATGASFAIAGAQVSDAAAYTVTITDGTSTVTTSAANLTVTGGTSTAPSIITQPVSTSSAVGGTVSFAVSATGNPLPSYQWQKNNAALSNSSTVSGATTATLTLSSVAFTDDGNYTVVVTNVAGTATSNIATLTILGGVAPSITIQPQSQSVNAGASVTFSVTATGTPAPTYQWMKNTAAISGATGTSYTISSTATTDAGNYSVVATNSQGSATSNTAVLTVTAATTPSITAQPQSQTVNAGDLVTFSVTASGSPTPSYQWQFNGATISGATSSTYSIATAIAANAGNYTVLVSNSAGSATSNAATLTVNTPPPPVDHGRIVNCSVSTTVNTGETFDFGFVVGGANTSGNKNVLMRAMGPTLGAIPGVSGADPDPALAFYNPGPTLVASDDNWGGDPTIAAATAAVSAFPFVSTDSKDAALYETIGGGDHFLRVSSTGSASGLVLAEIYDATPANSFTAATPRLVNVSVNKNVGNLSTFGFVIGGSTNLKVLIRAVGPTLNATFGDTAAMPDPQMTLTTLSGTVIDSNDNWGGAASLTAVFDQVAAFRLASPTSKDAVLVETLAPGAYTAQVTPVSGTATGHALIEVYEVPSTP